MVSNEKRGYAYSIKKYFGVTITFVVITAATLAILHPFTRGENVETIAKVTANEVKTVYEQIDTEISKMKQSEQEQREVKEQAKEVAENSEKESGSESQNIKTSTKEEIAKQLEEKTKKMEVVHKETEDKQQVESSAYIPSMVDEVTNTEISSGNRVVTYTGNGSQGKFKAYMDKDAITMKSSPQYKLKEQATIDENGIACVDGRMLVAVGNGHNAPVGTNIDVTLADGTVLKCKVGDIKQNRHTDSTNKICISNGSIIEFLVETSVMNTKAKQMGDMSYAGYHGGIIKVERID